MTDMIEIVDDMTIVIGIATDMTGIVTDMQDGIILRHLSQIVDMKIATLPTLHLEEVPDVNFQSYFRIEREMLFQFEDEQSTYKLWLAQPKVS
jgi:hypothetical protein